MRLNESIVEALAFNRFRVLVPQSGEIRHAPHLAASEPAAQLKSS